MVAHRGGVYQGGQCPLWVKSRHVQRTTPCPLCANSGHAICAWFGVRREVVAGRYRGEFISLTDRPFADPQDIARGPPDDGMAEPLVGRPNSRG